MRTRRLAAIVLLPLVLLAACGDDGGDPTIGGEGDDAGLPTTTLAGDDEDDDEQETTPEVTTGFDHTLRIDANGSSLSAEVGDVIAVILETCPSCGYSWQVMGDDGGGVLTLVSETDGESDNDEGEVGGTVDHTVVFEATAPGETSIALGYFPPADEAPEEVFSVDVTVSDGGAESDEVDAAMVLGSAENNTTVVVALGEAFDVSLEECVGCPYQWQVLSAPYEAVVALNGDETVRRGPNESESGEPMVGGTADRIFHFEAVGPGTTTISLGYIHAAETDPDSDADVYTLTIEVDASRSRMSGRGG